MGRNSIGQRLRKLEEQTKSSTGGFPPGWDFGDQVEEMLEALLVHGCAKTRQLCTDREINVLGAMHAFWRLPGGTGEHCFPSGAVATWSDNEDGTSSLALSRGVSVEDLPEEVQKRVERMEPEKQQVRERWLYNQRGRPDERRLFLEKYRRLAVAWVRGEG